MPRILVLYGTSEGQTEKIARTMAQTLRGEGHQAEAIRAGHSGPDIRAYDGVIVAASIHAGRFQKPVVEWVRQNAAAIAARPNAFVPVCLSILQSGDPRVKADQDAIIARFVRDTQWLPSVVKFEAGALLYTQYNFFIRFMMKRIAARAGGDTDTTRDYVYTDWPDVRRFASEFGRRSKRSAA